MINKNLLVEYILESIEHSKKPSFMQKVKDFEHNLKNAIKEKIPFTDLYNFTKHDKSYSSPPKDFEKKYNIKGISQEYTFPNNMSNEDFEKNILGWGNAERVFQFNIEEKYSKLNSLSTKDFKFILDNNTFINNILSKLNFKSQDYSMQRKIVWNILLGMTSCFNESDIDFFLSIRIGNSREHLSEEYEILRKSIEEITGEDYIFWFPSIDTMKYIYSQLSKGSYN